MRSTPRVVQTSITIGAPAGSENLTIAWEIVGMMAIAIMAMSAAQTPTCSTTREKLRYELPNCPDGWFLIRRTARAYHLDPAEHPSCAYPCAPISPFVNQVVL